MKKTILSILKSHQGQWISGEEICHVLGVSRTAVWKHIKSIKEDGYQLDTQTKLGYRLLAPPDILYPAEVTAGLTTSYVGQRVVHYQAIASTNEEIKNFARQGAEAGTIVVTEKQTSGKGRRGRVWLSPAGKDIMVSVLFYPQISPAEVPQLSMLAAVVLAQAIQKVTDFRPDIKWPNDLLGRGEKMAGILVEMAAEVDAVKYVVVGMGLNVNSTEEDWQEEIKHKTTSLKEILGKPVSRVKLLQAILQDMEEYYELWQQEGFAPILKQWRTWCVSQRCPARVETLRGSYQGFVEGVNNQGALLLRLSSGELKTFTSGDVSLRL